MLISLAFLVGCAPKQPVKPVTFVLHYCKTVEELNVADFKNKTDHVELTCDCNIKSERLDAKTGKTIVECSK